MRKLTPKGIISLTTTAFLFFILTSLIYFNDQVEFNAVEAKWELQENYIQRDFIPATYTTETIEQSGLRIDGVNDYVYTSTSLNTLYNSNTTKEIEIDFTYYSGDGYIMYANSSNNIATYIDIYQGQIQVRLGTTTRVTGIYPNTGDDINIKVIHNNSTMTVLVNDNIVIDNMSWVMSGFNNRGITFGASFQGAGAFIFIDLKYVSIINNNIQFIEYLIDEGTGNILNDSSGNNYDATIYGATWLENEIVTVIDQPTQSAIDSYQVFENIRNNASTVNPLGFMNTLVSIPSQAVGYYDSFTDFVTGGFGIFDIPDMTFSELSDTWWARLPIIYDKFNERYGPLGD